MDEINRVEDNNETPQFNKYLRRTMKKILNYENKNNNLNEILDEIRFPDRIEEFNDKIFEEDFNNSLNVIKTFKSDKKQIDVRNDIFALKRHVFTHYHFYISKIEDIDYDTNIFFSCIVNILSNRFFDDIEKNVYFQTLIINFLENVKQNKAFENLREIFNTNTHNQSNFDPLAYFNYMLNINIGIHDTMFNTFIELIKIINSSYFKFKNIRDFLAYDLDEVISQLLEKKGLYMFEYTCIINGEYPNQLLANYLKENIKFTISENITSIF